jgi:uncharacterized protein
VSGKCPKRKSRPGVDAYGRNRLHNATVEGDLASVNAMLRAGADPNVQDDNGWAPLHFAAQINAAKMVDLLIVAGANVNIRDSNGNTPLSTAVFNSRGNGDVIGLLRRAGADPLIVNAYGVSPLSLARTIANFNVAQFFEDVAESNGA